MTKINNSDSSQNKISDSVDDSQIPYVGMGNGESEVSPEDTNWLEIRDNLPEFYTLQEFEQLKFNVEPIIDGFLFKANISIIGAKPKVGKSTLMRFAAKCVVDGDDFLGRKVTPGKVLYLALEEPLQNVQRDFLAMEVKNKDNLLITSLSNEPNKLLALKHLVHSLKPVLVVADTMIHVTNIKDMNDYVQTTSALRVIRDLAVTNNCHVLLVHHSRKGDSTGNDSTTLGSQGINGAVDLISSLEMDSKKVRLLSTNGRSGVHFDKTPLHFDQETMHFSVEDSYTPKSEDRIFEAIRNNPGIARKPLQNLLHMRSQDLSNGLSILKDCNLIEVTKADGKSTYTIKQAGFSVEEGEE